jgi:hypothetical protein
MSGHQQRPRRDAPQGSASSLLPLAGVALGLVLGIVGTWFTASFRPQAKAAAPAPVGPQALSDGRIRALESQLATATERIQSLEKLVDLYRRGAASQEASMTTTDGASPTLDQTLAWIKSRLDRQNLAGSFITKFVSSTESGQVQSNCAPEVQYKSGAYRIVLRLPKVDIGSLKVRQRDVKDRQFDGISSTEVAGVAFVFAMSGVGAFEHSYPGTSFARDTFEMPVDNEVAGEKLVSAFHRAVTLCGGSKDLF